ncbi:hypothetical protein HPP92_010873 [Vanilla planifolia]|uniref:starch synthase n=1 Tax=Vanilla planifolia TaxID=51239 RepID=A0A835R5Y9_VANPL|nr:hypothetical protein HPP92_010873 [Vanilla planifolia]
MHKSVLHGDWWSCKVYVPREAYRIDFVFFNGVDVYENNNQKDFSVAVEGGMDEALFEDFLLEELQKNLRLAAEQAEKDRKAEEKRRMEAERIAIEADRAQARLEVKKRQEACQRVKRLAVESVQGLWHMKWDLFKGKNRIRLYYNRRSRPLEYSKDLWIHGGYNNWIEVTVPDNALILDWVFADGPPQKAKVYDNNKNQDFHASISKVSEEKYWIEEENRIFEVLQMERRLNEKAKLEKAEKIVLMKAEMKERTLKRFFLSQKHVVYTEPTVVHAGKMVKVFYNPSSTVLNGKLMVWFRCSFNRWAHRNGLLPPQKWCLSLIAHISSNRFLLERLFVIAILCCLCEMYNLVYGISGEALVFAVKVPLDAYMMDFVFSEREDGGIYDNKMGMDYHIPVTGGVAKEPAMHIIHISVEMAPIAKVSPWLKRIVISLLTSNEYDHQVGGLGDVVTSLSRAVQELGHNVDIILPKYDCLKLNHVAYEVRLVLVLTEIERSAPNSTRITFLGAGRLSVGYRMEVQHQITMLVWKLFMGLVPSRGWHSHRNLSQIMGLLLERRSRSCLLQLPCSILLQLVASCYLKDPRNSCTVATAMALDLSLCGAIIWGYFDLFFVAAIRVQRSSLAMVTVELEGSLLVVSQIKSMFWAGCIYGRNNDGDRFGYFCHAALEFLLQSEFRPDILHCHDWSSAPVAWLFKEHYKNYGLSNARVIFTIHNLEFGIYQIGKAMSSCDKATTEDLVIKPDEVSIRLVGGKGARTNNFMGIYRGEAMRKVDIGGKEVSNTYSKEISGNPAISPYLYKFHGILNGIDPDIWDPYNDNYIPGSHPRTALVNLCSANFFSSFSFCLIVGLKWWLMCIFPTAAEESVTSNITFIGKEQVAYTSENLIEGKRAAKEALQQKLGLDKSDCPLVGIITRLTVQKGIHLIKHAIWRTIDRNGQVVLLGSAPDPRIQNDFVNLANQLHSSHSGQVRLCLTYDEPLSHLIYAGSDFILVPSIFEPCGLTQLVAMRYGSIPVVRKTGGLYDTVFDVDHDKERAQSVGLEPNGFSFEFADSGGVDYALNRAISAWYKSREWLNQLCKRVMEQDWSWNRPALDYIELYYAARK